MDQRDYGDEDDDDVFEHLLSEEDIDQLRRLRIKIDKDEE